MAPAPETSSDEKISKSSLTFNFFHFKTKKELIKTQLISDLYKSSTLNLVKVFEDMKIIDYSLVYSHLQFPYQITLINKQNTIPTITIPIPPTSQWS